MVKGKSLFRLLNYLKPYGGLVAGALIMGILGAGISLIFPWLVKIIIDQVLIKKDLLLPSSVPNYINTFILYRHRFFKKTQPGILFPV